MEAEGTVSKCVDASCTPDELSEAMFLVVKDWAGTGGWQYVACHDQYYVWQTVGMTDQEAYRLRASAMLKAKCWLQARLDAAAAIRRLTRPTLQVSVVY